MKTKTSTKKMVQKPAAKKAVAEKATARKATTEPAKTAAKQGAEKAARQPAVATPGKAAEMAPGKSAAAQAQKAPTETTASQAEKVPKTAACQAEKASGKSADSQAKKAQTETDAAQAKGGAATPAAPAGAKMLFRRGNLVAHASGATYRVVRPPYTVKSVITVDAVEVRDGADRGLPRAIPTEKFVGPAGAAGEKKDVKTEGSAGTAGEKKTGEKEAPAAKGAAKGEKTAKPSVAAAMRKLFAERGLEATYAQAEAAARAAKPDTKFGKSHWAWYRAQHKKKGAAPASRKAQA